MALPKRLSVLRGTAWEHPSVYGAAETSVCLGVAPPKRLSVHGGPERLSVPLPVWACPFTVPCTSQPGLRHVAACWGISLSSHPSE